MEILFIKLSCTGFCLVLEWILGRKNQSIFHGQGEATNNSFYLFMVLLWFLKVESVLVFCSNTLILQAWTSVKGLFENLFGLRCFYWARFLIQTTLYHWNLVFSETPIVFCVSFVELNLGFNFSLGENEVHLVLKSNKFILNSKY